MHSQIDKTLCVKLTEIGFDYTDLYSIPSVLTDSWSDYRGIKAWEHWSQTILKIRLCRRKEKQLRTITELGDTMNWSLAGIKAGLFGSFYSG